MKNIILATLAAGLMIVGASTAEAKVHHGHRGHGGHHGGHHNPFYGLPRCNTHYGWHNGHYVTTRICKTVTW